MGKKSQVNNGRISDKMLMERSSEILASLLTFQNIFLKLNDKH